ncbi:diaminohydroxyphosphoribosylaminopyrimidine deaminase [Pricia antarctica]|uniref:Riboflavin biosynthesis protein RibD n=1 Tax=Pricia antarctica TaxID=641691 RepID=A0A1G7EW77_9FLAO|nr:bifunctional diaminohydroxyphosphoribosylaminopyrimidine deaminase/5-amino-6-(5-phosphoribosylamino)uracil reductase RibD [Pricia antarctica]SDE67887.1 diaminohydroxyphosphoribosylaminopyrimidine deaminase [Pricia antarctica]
MSRAIEIARNGLGPAAPNPMVGAVLVHDGQLIGEGFTSPYGGPHAEVNAIGSVADKALLKKATLYVTLEPCSHFGKTPPCADLIIKHKIPSVVVGLLDPHEKVAGQGIAKLRNAGVDVITGILESECRDHHKRFLTFHEKKRPYIVLKWAETADGFIAPDTTERNENPEPYWISNSYSRQLTHKWRSEEQAILVGTNTVLEDNPKLDVRQWTGKNPLRVVLDRKLRINGDYHVLDGSNPTLILTEIAEASRYYEGIDYRILDFSKDVISQICSILHEINILSVLVEGGAQTLQSFIDAGLWDEARIFTGTSSFKKGIAAPHLSGKIVASTPIGLETLKIHYND